MHIIDPRLPRIGRRICSKRGGRSIRRLQVLAAALIAATCPGVGFASIVYFGAASDPYLVNDQDLIVPGQMPLPRDDTSSEVLYFKFVVEPTSDFRTEPYFAALQLTEGGTPRLGVGNAPGAYAYSAFSTASGDDVDLKSANADPGNFFQLVRDTDVTTIVFKVKYNPDAYDTITVWLDPDPSKSETQQPASLTTTFTADASFDEMHMREGGLGTGADGWTFSRILITTTFGETQVYTINESVTNLSPANVINGSGNKLLQFKSRGHVTNYFPDHVRGSLQWVLSLDNDFGFVAPAEVVAANARYRVEFDVVAPGSYKLDISSELRGALTILNDDSGVGDVTGSDGGTVMFWSSTPPLDSGHLYTPNDVVKMNRTSNWNESVFGSSSGSINGTSNGLPVHHTLEFGYVVRCEAVHEGVGDVSPECAWRFGLSDDLTITKAGDYPGIMYPRPEGLAFDGHTVTVSVASACGDGVTEGAEECDEGIGTNGTSSSCCSSVCAYETGGTECRASADMCDLAETCTGTTGGCPPDDDGPVCGSPYGILDGAGNVYSYPSTLDLAADTNATVLGALPIIDPTGIDNAIAADNENVYLLDRLGQFWSFPITSDIANPTMTFLGQPDPALINGSLNSIAASGTAFYRLDSAGNFYSYPTAADLGNNTNATYLGAPHSQITGDLNSISADGELFYRVDQFGGLYSFPTLSDLAVTNSNWTNLCYPCGIGNGQSTSILSVVYLPEPGAGAMLGMGLVLIGLLERRRRDRELKNRSPERFRKWTSPVFVDTQRASFEAFSNASGLTPPRWLWRRARL